MSDGDGDSPEPVAKPTLKQRLKDSFAEYGRIAVITYLVLSGLTIAGFSIAIGIGAEPSSATGFLGVIGAGWLAAKATMPIRILITLGITPGIAFVVRRRSRKRAVAETTETGESGSAESAAKPAE